MAKKTNKPQKKSAIYMVLLVPLMLAIIVLYKSAFVLLLLGMLPTIVAHYAETTPQKTRTCTIFCCNLAGLLPYFTPFALSGGRWEDLGYRMADLDMWLRIYGMAACGYGLIKLCPAIYHGFLRISYASKAFQMQQKQDSLLKQWGDDVATLSNSIK